MYIEPSVQDKVLILFKQNTKTIHDSLGIEFTHLAKDRVCAVLPVDSRSHQPIGLLHGGASVVLAESCASVGAWLNIDETKYAALGLEINANHLRAVKSGIVTAEATPIHIGAVTHVWNISLTNERGSKTCVARCTMMIRSIA